ncbi:MAG: hypothetical protein QQW96_10565 [Tychonema bourrellyi B0820]|uniref:hypothetical protein n=1 Tax=Tychonema bourrellyi TaxID=54313 RepID=UPI0015D5020F|nr:hypothetical protein [Tychonema bourrellyi]MDQ2098078.1 hypothetical protein [Tychonema bourrellyi B0820]
MPIDHIRTRCIAFLTKIRYASGMGHRAWGIAALGIWNWAYLTFSRAALGGKISF